jgi:rubrerythrin
MKLQTASAVISLAKSLEDESAKFYEGLAQRYTQGKDIFLSFAMENKKNIVQIERAYYGVITDAIEGCFAFDIEPDAYAVKTTLAKTASYSDALGRAIELEEKIGRFYSDAAEQSKSLMADVPRAFTLIARKRSDRGAKLMSLLGKKG